MEELYAWVVETNAGTGSELAIVASSGETQFPLVSPRRSDVLAFKAWAQEIAQQGYRLRLLRFNNPKVMEQLP